MRLEVGKKYRTREGLAVVRVVSRVRCYWFWKLIGFPYTHYGVCVIKGGCFPSGRQLFTRDGIWHHKSKFDAWDLVEEVP